MRTTPFHPRLSELNDQGLYTHWQGTLSPLRYTHAPKHEYFAVRNSVGVFDTSPLYKYLVTGPDAERLLAGALVRDVRHVPAGAGAVHRAGATTAATSCTTGWCSGTRPTSSS